MAVFKVACHEHQFRVEVFNEVSPDANRGQDGVHVFGVVQVSVDNRAEINVDHSAVVPGHWPESGHPDLPGARAVQET